MASRERQRDVLWNPESVRGLLFSGALAGAVAACPLLAWRLGAVLAREEAPSGEEARAGLLALPTPTEQPAPTPASEPHLRFPVDAADRTRLRASFDEGRSGGRRHRALDIFAPRRAQVRAVEAGAVLRLSRSRAGGTAIEQADASGRYCYYYAHLERYAAGLREGQSVAAGQVIGYVGTTGNAPRRSPHLHLAVFRSADGTTFGASGQGCWSGTAIDPYPLLHEANEPGVKPTEPASPPAP